MRNLFIVDIEPLDNRYTKQWQEWIPTLAREKLGKQFSITQISATPYPTPQPGAFFNFASTCKYKAEQAVQIAEMFEQGEVKENDVFFFTDAWNQTVHTVKYLSELNGVPVKIAGIWHAGAYDPTDILALRIENKRWVRELERSYYRALDMNFFGTMQHMIKFCDNLSLDEDKAHVCGYPLEWISALENSNKKEDIVVFPHRLNEDKAPWIFDELKEEVHKTHPHIVFAKTQEMNMSKEGYYEFLKKCKVVFSANKHENLGIGTFEAMSAGCIPLVPNKLSYAEMYGSIFKYTIDTTVDLYTEFEYYKPVLAKLVIDFVENYHNDVFQNALKYNITQIQKRFFSGDEMMRLIRTL